MLPIKPDKIIKETAKEMGISEELVSDVVYFYYGAIKKMLVGLVSEKVTVAGLGSFKPRYWLYGKHKSICKAIIYKVDPKKSLKHFKLVADAKDKLITLEHASDRIAVALLRRGVIREIRNEYDELIEKGEDPAKKLAENLRRVEEQNVSEEVRRENSRKKVEDMFAVSPERPDGES